MSSLNHRLIERQLLDSDLTEAMLGDEPHLAESVRGDMVLTEALREFDALRASIQLPDATDIDQPIGGWAAMELRLMEVIRSA